MKYGTGKSVNNRCQRCGRGGARCWSEHGLVHKTCLNPEERKRYENKLKESYTANVKSRG